MNILYEKTRLRGRMFRGGYEGEGTGIELGNGDGPGSGWGGTSQPTTTGGKPGEDAMAQAGSQQLGSVADRSDYGAMEGFNPNNPSQTVDLIQASENVNKALSFGVPIAVSAMVPGFGLAMTLAKSGAKMMGGAPMSEVLSDIGPGIVNGKLNELTGGLYGKAMMASNLSSFMGGPSLPNAGKEVVSGIIGNAPGRAGATLAGSPGAASNGDGAVQVAQPGATAAPAATTPAAAQDVNYASIGIDSAGWTTAGHKYMEAKNV